MLILDNVDKADQAELQLSSIAILGSEVIPCPRFTRFPSLLARQRRAISRITPLSATRSSRTVVKDLLTRRWTHLLLDLRSVSKTSRQGLISRLPTRPQRNDASKYAKFAYSSSFGFSIPTGSYGLEQVCPDSTLALSDDPKRLQWTVRRQCEDIRISEKGVIRSTWRPWSEYKAFNTSSHTGDVAVTTWLVPPKTTSTPYHTRVHRIDTSRTLATCEGGFAIASTSTVKSKPRSLPVIHQAGAAHGRLAEVSRVFVHSDGGMSGLISLYGPREGRTLDVDSNSNLMCPRTILPTLQGTIEPGTTWLASRVFGVPSGASQEYEWVKFWDTESERVMTSIEDMLDELDVL